MDESANRTLAQPSLAGAGLFFVLVLGWTWSSWIGAAASGASAQSTSGMALIVLGLLGPMLGGICFAYFTLDHEGWREYWVRIIDAGRIPARWFLVVLLFVPCLMALAVLMDLLLSGDAVLTQIGKRAMPYLAAPLSVPPFLFHVLVYGPLPEELGWRGYALDRLQARWSALVASLVLGAFWALWHLPLFFIRDMNPHYSEGAWSLWFWLFMVEVVANAVIYTWIFNNTRHSTLAAILFHFISNLTAELTNATAGTNLYSTLLWIVAAVAVVASWGGKTLTGGEDAPPG